MSAVKPMRHHAPGWTLELNSGEQYWLWAPQTADDVPEGSIVNGKPREPRKTWSACWQNGDGEAGDYTTGARFEDVVAIFPGEIAQVFDAAVSHS